MKRRWNIDKAKDLLRFGTLMQLPWRTSRTPARRQTGSWPPTATQWLLCALAASLLLQWFWRASFTEASPVRLALALSAPGLWARHYWQPVSYLFLSYGAWADFASLLTLYLAGSQLEFIIGRRHLLQLWFMAGILGGLGQLAYNIPFHATPAPVLVGPAAAVMGVFLALTSVMPDLELAPLLGFPLPFWLKIKHVAFGAMLACATYATFPLLHWSSAVAQQQAVRCLVGCLTGCVYLRQLGFGRRIRVQDETAEREPMLEIPVFSQASESAAGGQAELPLPRFTERERRMTPRQYISEQIDPILDKISLHGIGCLTSEERRILEKGRDKISQRDS